MYVALHYFSFLLFFLHGHQIADYAIFAQGVVIHFGNFVIKASDDGNAILMRHHHGLVGRDLGQTRDLDQRSSNMFSRVKAIVIDPNFPGFISLLSTITGRFLCNGA